MSPGHAPDGTGSALRRIDRWRGVIVPDPSGRPQPGWHAYRPARTARLPSWAVEVVLTLECPAVSGSGAAGGEPKAMMLLRAPARAAGVFSALAGAAADVEAAAGVGPASGPRFVHAHGLPGLAPVTPAAALAQLELAGTRGLVPPARRRQPSAERVGPLWRSSPGSVLTCEGPSGVSAQAVIAVGGLGNVAAIAPRPGGALVLRAWRGRGDWGMACGLVLGAPEVLGLGREAGRRATLARAEGWHGAVLTGPAALTLARAGDPGQPAPEAAARSASGAQMAALLDACLSLGPADDPVTGPRWTLAVAP